MPDRFFRRSRAVGVLLVFSAVCSFADNWPSFRGIDGNGLGDGEPPIRWDIGSGQHIIWRTKVEGLALSSPIIWGNRLYLTTAVSQKGDPKFEPDPTFGFGIERDKEPFMKVKWSFNVTCKTTPLWPCFR